jgi:hypothetical protein
MDRSGLADVGDPVSLALETLVTLDRFNLLTRYEVFTSRVSVRVAVTA